MTIKDKLELGLKKDAAYRKDNLPPQQVRGPEIPAGPGRSAEIPAARGDKKIIPETHGRPLGEKDSPDILDEEFPAGDADESVEPPAKTDPL